MTTERPPSNVFELPWEPCERAEMDRMAEEIAAVRAYEATNARHEAFKDRYLRDPEGTTRAHYPNLAAAFSEVPVTPAARPPSPLVGALVVVAFFAACWACVLFAVALL